MRTGHWPLPVGRLESKFQFRSLLRRPLASILVFLFYGLAVSRAGDLRIFEHEGDIGSVAKAGWVAFDPTNHACVVAGAGANMWFTNDAFHFVWARVSGDFALKAGVEWLAAGGNPHRKACLVIRQGLGADAPYADVAVHGDGLISLQYREAPGGPTREIQARQPIAGPAPNLAGGPSAWVGIERQGEVFFVSLGADVATPASAAAVAAPLLRPCGAFIRLQFTDPLYAGLAVCAHDENALEKARFSEAELLRKDARSADKPALHCALETVSIASRDRRLIYHTLDHIEAPNWTPDGRYFLFNEGGRIYRLPVSGGKPERLDTGFADHCNNDHGLSPDGAHLAISDQSRGGKSLIYLLPIAGGTPHQITTMGPSYWHGWSPDGSTLVYCAERNGDFDVYSIPAEGGEEKRLTTAKGLDDGPDYSPDGKFIYFNSERTGRMQIWRMKPDGSQQEPVSSDEFNNWFPHPSPDGKWLAFLSYEKGVTGHPPNQPVKLRLMPVAGGPILELARLFGGQGSINVPSWSPDSKHLAFVSYELIHP